MTIEVRCSRARRARGALLCALVLTACGGSGDDETQQNPSPSLGDGGADSGTAFDPDDGRTGPDGAVQMRERPDPTCARATHTTGSYWICEEPIQPSQVAGLCWAAGGTMVKIDDADENAFLAGELISDIYSIGYSDAAGEGTWIWPDGSSGGYENWDVEQPGYDDFAYIKRENGAWATGVDEPRPYICEDWK